VGWRELEKALVEADLDVLNADIVEGEEVVTLRLEGMLDDEEWYELVLRAGWLAVRRSDGTACSLQALMSLGSAYWEEFSRRSAEANRVQPETPA
jgi:hypothetical protein